MAYIRGNDETILGAVDAAMKNNDKVLLAYTGSGDYKVKIKSGFLGFGERKYLASPEQVEKIKHRLRNS